MKRALSCYLCVLCCGMTVGAQVIPNGFRVVASSGTLSCDLLSAPPSAASETTSRPSRSEVARQIDQTEIGLDAIKHPLSAEEQKTAAHIHTFIAHARKALNYDDVDGASVLLAKARVLLLELSKECRQHSGQRGKLEPT